MYFGQAAIDYLAAEVVKSDAGASSHWQKFHSDFHFTGNGFQGLQGFGGCDDPYRGLRFGLHRLLQSKFRRIGQRFPRFQEIDGLASDIVSKQHRAYDLDVLRQTCTLAFLGDTIPCALQTKTTARVIGDGFGSMTALLLASRSAGRVILVNLAKTLLVDLWYLKEWMGDKTFASSVELVTSEEGLARALAPLLPAVSFQVIAIQASNHELLRQCPVDLVMNIASMQEMDPPVIGAYFDDLRAIASHRQLLFYCCNREEKTLPDGTVTRFAAYPWRKGDQILTDELCPWHQKYYSARPPFYRPYDGPIRHRLVRLA